VKAAGGFLLAALWLVLRVSQVSLGLSGGNPGMQTAVAGNIARIAPVSKSMVVQISSFVISGAPDFLLTTAGSPC
jgi:hypothetical protein